MNKAGTDFATTEQSVDTTVATIHTRQMQEIKSIANQLYTRVDIPEPFRMDAKAYIERPFFVENVEFSATDMRYHRLNVVRSQLPGDIIRSNLSLLNAMKMAAYYRADLVLNISMAGTITHAGCVLVGVIPPTPTVLLAGISHQQLINTVLSGPHGFLYANEATSVTLEVPWYCNTDMASLDMELFSPTYQPAADITINAGNYASLVMLVLNPLSPSTGSSTTVNIVVEACFKALDLVVPTPRFVEWVAEGFLDEIKELGSGLLNYGASGLKSVAGDAIDSARQAIFGWTGLHNANHATIQERMVVTPRNFPNVVDSQQFFEKLDPLSKSERILSEPNFGTLVDEMRVRHIISKKQMIGSVSVSTSDAVGKLLWVRPISPYQGGIDTKVPKIANNIELLHHVSRAWRGGLKLHIVSVMNNKQQVKLRVLKMYNPSTQALAKYPKYSSIVNAPSDLLEFTQGGQEHCINLPYLCRNDLTPCSRQLTAEALFHGVYYIYVAQPLVISDGSPTQVEFNIYMSGDDDLTFYGYATETGAVQGFQSFDPIFAQRQVATQKDMTVFELSKEYGIPVERMCQLNPHIVSSRIIVTGTLVRVEGFAVDEKIRKVAGAFRAAVRNKREIAQTVEEEEMEAQSVWSLSSAPSVDLYTLFQQWKSMDVAPREVKKKSIKVSCVCEMEAQSVNVMNEPQKQESASMAQDVVTDFNHIDRLVPNVDVRPYIRRMYKYGAAKAVVPKLESKTLDLPLATLLGEDPVQRQYTSTPITLLTNMYYGKNAGFKVKLRLTPLKPGSSFITTVRFLPQNMAAADAPGVILGTRYNSTVLPEPSDLYTQTPFGAFPLTYQTTPVSGNENIGSQLYEFIVPDVTFYKFMGGPNKFGTPSTVTQNYTISDFGTVLITIYNPAEEEVSIGVEIFVGLTDETRLGYHTIAPVILTQTLDAPEGPIISTLYGTGYGASPTIGFTPARNNFVYKGDFL